METPPEPESEQNPPMEPESDQDGNEEFSYEQTRFEFER